MDAAPFFVSCDARQLDPRRWDGSAPELIGRGACLDLKDVLALDAESASAGVVEHEVVHGVVDEGAPRECFGRAASLPAGAGELAAGALESAVGAEPWHAVGSLVVVASLAAEWPYAVPAPASVLSSPGFALVSAALSLVAAIVSVPSVPLPAAVSCWRLD